ncbi:MAG: D-glycero-beta-D-manno-heptose-1,7-bisphosphate 7-phosphatase [Gammaproteobacteria bacterium RIFCSPLOWO2_02_FULL_42_9]|nr:MAG: D-glycero-beta-D-manno-heptose-1,7-bisphosphate 7-phosphatase [Gammaproteobacteria bacterium RIFCSPLOWO2_02_FULL_42_9]
MKKLIILDRDGVINKESAAYIKSPDEWIPITGSLEAIAQLNKANFTVVVASNQSGVGRGLFSPETLEQIHQKMQRALKKYGGHIDKIYFCPHTPDDHCKCRKPKSGLFDQIKKDYDINLKKIYAVGNSKRDLDAAKACKKILVLTGHGKETLDENPAIIKTVTVKNNLAAAAAFILSSPAARSAHRE